MVRIFRKSFLVGLVALAGCCPPQPAPELSLHRKVTRLRFLASSYSNALASSESIISRAIATRYFSADAQRQTLNTLRAAQKDYNEHNKIVASCPEYVDSLIFPANALTKLELLAKNVEGFDGSTPEIQVYLAKSCPGLKAEKIESDSEIASEAAAEAATQFFSSLYSND